MVPWNKTGRHSRIIIVTNDLNRFPYLVPVVYRHQNKCYCSSELRSCVKEKVHGRLGFLVPNSPYSFCGRKATLKGKLEHQISGTV